MKRMMIGLFVFAIAVAVTPRDTLAAPFSYQGQLSKNSVLVNGTCNLQFSLYSAAIGGAPFNPVPLTQPNVTVSNGVFTVLLDFGAGAFDGTARWLAISVQGTGDPGYTPLTPLQAITAAPYASYAFGGNTGFTLPFNQAVNSTSQAAFQVDNTATTGFGHGIVARSYSTTQNAAGVVGEGSATSGITTGVHGTATFSPQGNGVVGKGNANGGYFQSFAPDVSGGYAGITGISVSTYGVKGISTNVAAVWGAASGSAAGVLGTSSGNGVEGRASHTGLFGQVGTFSIPASGEVYGARCYAFSSNAASAGVYGQSSAGTGVKGVSESNVGIWGESTTEDGVRGYSNGPSKSGVTGIANNATGAGGYFVNTAGGAAIYAVGLAKVHTLQILGADLAESFPVEGDRAVPGTVLMLGYRGAGTLRVSDEAYSRRVAGVVSGAHGLDAAVVLKGASFDAGGQVPVALSGRVWVKCDASRASIRVGDLLTTSHRAGHAMKATDASRMTGTILGKAMTELESGTGMVMVLVSLQ